MVNIQNPYEKIKTKVEESFEYFRSVRNLDRIDLEDVCDEFLEENLKEIIAKYGDKNTPGDSLKREFAISVRSSIKTPEELARKIEEIIREQLTAEEKEKYVNPLVKVIGSYLHARDKNLIGKISFREYFETRYPLHAEE